MLRNILVDVDYAGVNFANAIKTISGADVETVKCNESHTFAVLPKHWIMENPFA